MTPNRHAKSTFSTAVKVIVGTLVVLLLSAVLPVFGQAKNGITSAWTPPARNDAACAAIVKRNIFLADRRGLENAIREAERPRPEAPPPVETPPPPPPNPDASLVLVGMVIVDGQATAFIEDRGAGTITRVVEPGPFSQGRITSLSLAGVEYAADDAEPLLVRLRQTFTGQEEAAAPRATSSARSGGQATSSRNRTNNREPSGDAGNANDGLSPLERLRQRRLEEMQRNNEASP